MWIALAVGSGALLGYVATILFGFPLGMWISVPVSFVIGIVCGVLQTNRRGY